MSTTDAAQAWPDRPRVDEADWTAIAAEVGARGCATAPRLLDDADAAESIRPYDRDDAFRSTARMARHRLGEGEDRYRARPPPDAVEELRQALYPRLRPIARDWYATLGRPTPWPDGLDEWLDRCRAAGQTTPTPLILACGPGDWNALHQDRYGDPVFPLQVVVNLTTPEVDDTGGEFVPVEQRPRAQSRGTAVALPHGHGLVFTTRDRPVASQRGWSAAPVRHGVSVVRSGRRFTLGVLVHDAS